MAAIKTKPIPQLSQKDIKHFWRRVDVRGPDECWPTTLKGRNKLSRYGQIKVAGKHFSTHRIAYFIATGEDPGELFVCHSCDNPPCCNPKHLRKDTRRANDDDCTRKGRRPRSENHGRATLTNTQVLAIRDKYKRYATQQRVNNKCSYATLAREYKTTKHIISNIIRRQNWKYL